MRTIYKKIKFLVNTLNPGDEDFKSFEGIFLEVYNSKFQTNIYNNFSSYYNNISNNQHQVNHLCLFGAS